MQHLAVEGVADRLDAEPGEMARVRDLGARHQIHEAEAARIVVDDAPFLAAGRDEVEVHPISLLTNMAIIARLDYT